jgi:L-cystine transport system permease protein
MDFGFILEIFPSLISALPITIFIIIISGILGFLLAVIVTALRLKRIPVLHQLLEAYVSFMRSTPGIIHIFLVYYGLPVLLQVINIDVTNISRVVFSVVALVLYNGAFVSEILRPSYLAVSRDQFDAAKSTGMTKWQAHIRIIFPQVLPVALPSLGNALIDLLKDTSLLFLIGLIDIMGQAEIIIANTYGVYQTEVYFAVAIIYWMLSILLTGALSMIESKTSKYI